MSLPMRQSMAVENIDKQINHSRVNPYGGKRGKRVD